MSTMIAKAAGWLDEHEWDLGITLALKDDVTGQKADKALGHMRNKV